MTLSTRVMVIAMFALAPGLGTITYFNTGAPSTGYAAIFEFMKQFRRP